MLGWLITAVGCLQLRKRIEDKNRLLRQMASSSTSSTLVTPVDLSEVTERWDAFTASLQQYDAHLEGQRGALQQAVARQVEDFKGTIAGFASRWEACLKQPAMEAGQCSFWQKALLVHFV